MPAEVTADRHFQTADPNLIGHAIGGIFTIQRGAIVTNSD